MLSSIKFKILVFATVLFMAAGAAYAAQGVISAVRNVQAVSEASGFHIAPVNNVSVNSYSGDHSQPQVFEIIRPRGEPITLGRTYTSCSCIQLEASKRSFAQGERAFLTLRNVKPTPPNGQMYAFYVQLDSPIRTTLRQDTFVQSERFKQVPTYGYSGRTYYGR